MAKKVTKDEKKLVDQMVNTKEDELLKIKVQTVAQEIEKILLENNLALQPFLEYSVYGTIPRVKLVQTNEKTEESK